MLICVSCHGIWGRLTAGNGTNSNGIQRTLLSEDLGDELEEVRRGFTHMVSRGICQDLPSQSPHTEGAELAMKIKDPK